MGLTTLLTIIIIAALIIGLAVVCYLYFRERTLEQIRVDVYHLFLKAERLYLSGEGQQKMEYVIYRARSLLPQWAKFFVTDDLLEKVVQLWFDAVKDLLDDGKYNKST